MGPNNWSFETVHATWWWLSFADGERPKGDQFLGVSIVQGFDLATAAMMAHAKGCNPGGEVMGLPITDREVPEAYRERLLTREEVEALDRQWAEEGQSPDQR